MSQRRPSPQQCGQRKPKARGRMTRERRRRLAFDLAVEEVRRDSQLGERMALGAEVFSEWLNQRLESLIAEHEARLKARGKRSKRAKKPAK